MENIEHMFLEKLETNYFQTSNYIFDFVFEVTAIKRKITKSYYGKGKHKYENIKIKRDLSCNEKLVFIYLCRCANNNNAAFPSYNTIASNCGISRDSVRLSLDVLANNKFILKKNRGYISDRAKQVTCSYSNLYKINTDLSKLPHKIRNEESNNTLGCATV